MRCALALFAIGCTGGTTDTAAPALPGPVEPAHLYDDCAPWDGLALSFRFGLEGDGACGAVYQAEAELRVMFYDPLPDGPGLWPFGAVEDDGAAWFMDGADMIRGTEGWVDLSAFDGERATGSYEVVLEDGRTLAGAFRAVTRCPTDPDTPGCG